MTRLRAPAVLALTAALLVLMSAPAWAHATLLEATPGDGSVVATSPTTVALRFDQPVSVSEGAVKVLAPDGARVDAGAVTQREGGRVVADAITKPLAAGTYTVLWRVVSADTHAIFGAVTFSVGAPSASGAAAAAAADQQAAGAQAKDLLDLSRFVLYLGILVLVGGLAFVTVLWAPGRDSRPARRVLWAAWGLAVIGSVAGFLLQGAAVAGRPVADVFDPTTMLSVAQSRYGAAALARLAVLLLMVLVLDPGRTSLSQRPLAVVTAVLALGLLVTTSAVGHSATGDWAVLAWPADILHLVGASAWLGGLTFLALLVLRRPTEDLSRLLPRWSRYAAVAVAVLVVSGLYAGVREVAEPGALVATTYGRLLLVKVTLVLAMLALGAAARAWIGRHYAVDRSAGDLARPDTASDTASDTAPDGVARHPSAGGRVATLIRPRAVRNPMTSSPPDLRRLRRSVLLEAALATLVLAVTAVLVDTAPGRESYFPVFDGAASVTSGVRMTVHTDPARTGLNRLTVGYANPAGQALDVVKVTARWASSDGADVVPVDLPHVGPGTYTANGVQLALIGRWQLAVTTQTSDIDATTTLFTVDVR